MINEIAFEMATSSLRFGAGVTREVGMDLVDLGVKRALVVTDPNLTRLLPVQTGRRARRAGVEAEVLRPSRASSRLHGRSAKRFSSPSCTPVDGIVGRGGGSVIDTAKAVNLYTTCPPRTSSTTSTRHWEGDAGTRPAQASDRDSDDGGYRQ